MHFIDNIALAIVNLPEPFLHNWGYWIIFIVALLEATPFFGLFAPGQTVVTFGGVFAKFGIMDLGDVLWIAALGAILGDYLGYEVGRRYGHNFLIKYGKYFFFKEEYYKKTKDLMNNHTGKSMIIGRFNQITRAFAPFIAGATEVPPKKFWFYNIVGGTLWAVCFVILGYIFGKSYELASNYIGGIFIGAVVISIFIGWGYGFINKRKHIFKRFHLHILAINIASLYVFSKMAQDIVDTHITTKIDRFVNHNIPLIYNSISDKIMFFFTSIGDTMYYVPIMLAVLATLIHRKQWFYSAVLIISSLAGFFSEMAIKVYIHRPRPPNALLSLSDFSFPSAHATMATVLFTVIAYAFRREFQNKIFRYLFVFANILVFLSIGFSRIYLNVHWASDVVGGFALGLFVVTLTILICKVTVDLIWPTKNLEHSPLTKKKKTL